MGRPSSFTKDIADEIVDNMERGAGMSRAALIVGIDEKTIYNWRRTGRKQKRGRLRMFALDVDRIMAEHDARAERTILQKMSSPSEAVALNAAQFWVERRLPDEYGKRDKLDIQIANAVQLLLDDIENEISKEAFAEVVDAIARRAQLGALGGAPSAITA